MTQLCSYCLLAGAIIQISVSLPAQSLSPQVPSRLRHQAEEARAADRIGDAVRLYRAALKERPDWTDGWWALGTLLYDADLFSDADHAFQHFVAMAPRPAPAFAFLGLCEYETGKYDDALLHFQQWGRDGALGTRDLIPVTIFRWGALLTRKGEFQQALYFLTSKASKQSEGPDVTEAVGLAALQMRYLPTEYPVEMRALVASAGRLQMDVTLRKLDRVDGERSRLVHSFGNAANVHLMLGTQYVELHQMDRATGEFQEELTLFADSVPAKLQLAAAYMEQMQPEKALPVAQQAVSEAPESYGAHYTLGQALLNLGRAAESLPQLETCRKLAPRNPYLHFALAKAYSALGRTVEASQERSLAASLKEEEHRMMERVEGAK